jgi:hypothetical protein
MRFTGVSASSSPILRDRRSVAFCNQRGTGGAMHQGSKGRDQMDTPVVRLLRHQRDASSAPRTRIQPGQFHAHTSDAQSGGVVIADQPAREADQGRRGGRRYVTFQMAKVAVSRRMFADILSLIARLRASPAPA